jgi:hypothetical protein
LLKFKYPISYCENGHFPVTIIVKKIVTGVVIVVVIGTPNWGNSKDCLQVDVDTFPTAPIIKLIISNTSFPEKLINCQVLYLDPN